MQSGNALFVLAPLVFLLLVNLALLLRVLVPVVNEATHGKKSGPARDAHTRFQFSPGRASREAANPMELVAAV